MQRRAAVSQLVQSHGSQHQRPLAETLCDGDGQTQQDREPEARQQHYRREQVKCAFAS